MSPGTVMCFDRITHRWELQSITLISRSRSNTHTASSASMVTIHFDKTEHGDEEGTSLYTCGAPCKRLSGTSRPTITRMTYSVFGSAALYPWWHSTNRRSRSALMDNVEACVVKINRDFPSAHIVLAGDLNQLLELVNWKIWWSYRLDSIRSCINRLTATTSWTTILDFWLSATFDSVSVDTTEKFD